MQLVANYSRMLIDETCPSLLLTRNIFLFQILGEMDSSSWARHAFRLSRYLTLSWTVQTTRHIGYEQLEAPECSSLSNTATPRKRKQLLSFRKFKPCPLKLAIRRYPKPYGPCTHAQTVRSYLFQFLLNIIFPPTSKFRKLSVLVTFLDQKFLCTSQLILARRYIFLILTASLNRTSIHIFLAGYILSPSYLSWFWIPELHYECPSHQPVLKRLQSIFSACEKHIPNNE